MKSRNPASRPSTPRKAPITGHPLFPAIIALWFGALFGLGSLAIRPGLIEALVLKLQIDLIVPAAAPPLGVTARLLLSLGMALVGGTIGALIARRITRPRVEPRERRRGAGASVAGASGRNGFVPAETDQASAAQRRRPLTIDEEHEPVYHHELAPLPGGAPQILDVTGFDFSPREEGPIPPAPAASSGPDAAALDLTGFLSGDGEPQPLPANQDSPAMMEDSSRFAAPRAQDADPRPFAAPVQAGMDAPHAVPSAAAGAPFAPQPFATPPFQAPAAPPVPEYQPPEYRPQAFAAPEPAAAPLARFDAPAEPVARPADEPVEAMPEPSPGDALMRDAVERIVSRDLSELSQLQLIERLARSLQARRSAPAPQAPAAPLAEAVAVMPPFRPVADEPPVIRPAEPLPAEPLPAEPLPVDPLPAASAAAPQAAHPAESLLAQPPLSPAPLSMPAALRPIGFDEPAEDEDLAAILPPRHIAMPAPAPHDAPAPLPLHPDGGAQGAAPADHGADHGDEDGVLEDGYSSLLDLSRPLHQRTQFVRIEEPEAVAEPEPVVVFPGHAQRSQAAFAAQTAPFAPPSAAAMAAPSAGAAPLRRFDAPASAASPAQPVSAAPLPALDPAETERALRTALSTLQRMSATG